MLIPFSITGVDDESKMPCPVCGYTYTHHSGTTVYVRPGGEDTESIATTMANGGGFSIAEKSDNPSLRRDAVVLHFSCEAGCLFDLQFAQHKGETFVEMHHTGSRDVDYETL